MSLSCSNCRRRKIRCDKAPHCTQCQKADLPCVYPERQQRPSISKRRHEDVNSIVGPDQSTLIIGHAPDRNARESHVTRNEDLQDEYSSFVQKQDGTRMVNANFWDQLEETAEINGNIQPRESAGTLTRRHPVPSSRFLFGNRVTPNRDSVEGMAEKRVILFNIYFDRVHPICRLLHQPTAFKFIAGVRELTDQTTQRLKHESLEAIYYAISFAALTSLSNAECRAKLKEDRSVLQKILCADLEDALTACDLLNTREIVTLQAFILYILSLHSGESTQSSWTLLGLAVRIAQGLGIHRDGEGDSHDVFHAEMRRRIWWQLVVLDVLLSNDRGSEPLIAAGSFSTRRPLHIDDDDIHSQISHAVRDRSGMVDMTLPLTYMDGFNVLRTLNVSRQSTEAKADLANSFTERWEQLYLQTDNTEVNLSDARTWLVYMSGQLITLMMWLAVQYPLHSKLESAHEVPKRHTLRTVIALLALKQRIEKDESASKFVWWFRMIEPWHALAVALSILCSEHRGELVEQAWPIVDHAYVTCRARFSNATHWDLWSPLASLMARARAVHLRPGGSPVLNATTVSSKSVENDMTEPKQEHIQDKTASTIVTSSQFTFKATENAPILQFGLHSLAWNADSSPGESWQGSDNWYDWNMFVSDLALNDMDSRFDLTDAWLM